MSDEIVTVPRRMRDMVASNPIRLAREKRGFNVSQLAIAIGVTGSMIYRYERGMSRPTPERMARIMNVLGDINIPRDFTKWHNELREIAA